jgi:hypothetical protein
VGERFMIVLRMTTKSVAAHTICQGPDEQFPGILVGLMKRQGPAAQRRALKVTEDIHYNQSFAAVGPP